MKIFDVRKDTQQPLNEMARTAEICKYCNRTKVEGHYYYQKDKKFHCKGGGGQVFEPGGVASSNQQVPAASTGATPTIATPQQTTVTPQQTPVADKPVIQQPARPQLTLETWLKKHGIDNYTIVDGKINVDGDVSFKNLSMVKLPVKFGKITGAFSCIGDHLTSFENFPDEVGDMLEVNHNQITSFIGCTQIVGGSAVFSQNPITSIQGLPMYIGNDVGIDTLHLDKLDQLKSLQGIHKIVKRCFNTINIKETPIESHILGLLLIDGLTELESSLPSKAQDIIKRHLEGEKDIHMCQEELIDAGFAQLAKL